VAPGGGVCACETEAAAVEPHYLDVWLPTHNGDEAVVEKLVSNNIKCYA
jgi:hypothetical protein